MDNMINFLLENAKQTVVNARTALSAVGIWQSHGNYESGTTGTASTGTSAADTGPGFNSGSDLPPAWD